MAKRQMIVEVIANDKAYTSGLSHAKSETKAFTSELTKNARGALAGSGAFAAMGRSLAFASGGFLVAAGGAQLLRSSFDEAQKGDVAIKSLNAAILKTGESTTKSIPAVKAWALSQAKFGVSATDAETALARLVPLTHSSAKAQLAYTAALEISKSTGKSFNAVALATGKAFGGQTTALARYIGHIKANISAQTLFQQIQSRFGGQAIADTTAAQMFSAELENTEEIIGQALLPTINKYLESGSKWLEQMDRSGKTQKFVTHAVHDFSDGAHVVVAVLKDAAKVIRVVDDVTGGLKHTLELIIALKMADKFLAIGQSIGFINKEATLASATGLTRMLGLLSRLAKIGVISVAFRFPGAAAVLGATGGEAAAVALPSAAILGPAAAAVFNDRGTRVIGDVPGSDKRIVSQGGKLFIENKPGGRGGAHKTEISASKAGELLGFNLTNGKVSKKFFVPDPRDFVQLVPPETFGGDALTGGPKILTAKQKEKLKENSNKFFDSAISRILNNSSLDTSGTTQAITTQIGGIDKAAALIQKRLEATKDVTRRLNLEDELLQLAAQKKALRQQLAQEFIATLNLGLDKAQATQTLSDDLAALAKIKAGIQKEIKQFGSTADLQSQLFQTQQQIKQTKLEAISRKEFFTLGLSPTGDTRTETKATLKKRLGTFEQNVKGTVYDTHTLQKKLAGIKKVLSDALVPTDVRAKLQSQLDDLTSLLNKSVDKNIVKWKHLSSSAFLAGIPNLTAAQKKQLTARFDGLGPGATIPGAASGAFAKGGAVHLVTDISLDGHKVAKAVTTRQIKKNKQRTLPRGV